jgi:hypothetical protein
VIKERRNWISV